MMMNAAKRKFHHLLDSITKKAGLPSTDSSATDTVNKRRRILHPAQRWGQALERAQSAGPLGSAPVDHSYPTEATSQTPEAEKEVQKTPQFNPWDRYQFLDRLESFRDVSQWSSKPSSINEVAWAKRGWRCIGQERVGCNACGKERVVLLRSSDPGIRRVKDQDEDNNAQRQLVGGRSALVQTADRRDGNNRSEQEANARDQANETDLDDMLTNDSPIVRAYVHLVISEHRVECLWRERGCDDFIFHISMPSSQQTLERLQVRTRALLHTIGQNPPDLVLPNLLLSSDSGSSRPLGSILGEVVEPARVEACAQMALFGWQALETPSEGLINCKTCFRRVGLWLFSKMGAEQCPSISFIQAFDPIAEHRDYCPWVNANSQSGFVIASSKEPAWQTAFRQLSYELAHPPHDKSPGDEETDVASCRPGELAGERLDAASLDEADAARLTRLSRLRRMLSTTGQPTSQ